MTNIGRRTAVAAASLSIVAGGALWSGCGSSNDDSTDSVSNAIQQGINTAQQGVNQAQKKLNEATKNKKQLQGAVNKANNAAEQAKKQLNQAAEQAQNAVGNSGY